MAPREHIDRRLERVRHLRLDVSVVRRAIAMLGVFRALAGDGPVLPAPLAQARPGNDVHLAHGDAPEDRVGQERGPGIVAGDLVARGDLRWRGNPCCMEALGSRLEKLRVRDLGLLGYGDLPRVRVEELVAHEDERARVRCDR